MKKDRIKILFAFVIILLFGCRTTDKLSIYDLSTPDKTIEMYFQAFISGDDSLFDKVLGPNAVIPEFNPIQKITEPHPDIIRPEIVSKKEVGQRRKYADPDFFTEPSDVEVYVNVRYDEKYFKDKALPVDHRVFILRNIGSDWKIIAEAPFWPENVGPDNGQ